MRNVSTVVALLLGSGLLWLIVMWPWSEPPAAPAAPALEGTAGMTPTAPQPDTAPAAQAPPTAAPSEPQPTAAPREAAHADAAAEARTAEPDLFDDARGPLDALRGRFEHEPRDSAASEVEATIREAFAPEQAHSELLRHVLCRATVCRLELRWTADKLGSYVAAMGRLSQHLSPELASTPRVSTAASRDSSVELYLERKRSP